MENKSTCEIDNDGAKRWYLNGELHREDGPAIEFADDGKQWCINGEYHRLNGPAYIGAYGYTEWWINGHDVTKEITQWATENDIDLDNLTEVDKLMIKLTWAYYGQ